MLKLADKIEKVLDILWQATEGAVSSLLKAIYFARLDLARLCVVAILIINSTTSKLEFWMAILALVVYFAVKVYNVYTFNLRNEIPVPRKKFVKENESGALQIDDGDIFEMLQYVNTLQKYFEMNGVLKDEEKGKE